MIGSYPLRCKLETHLLEFTFFYPCPDLALFQLPPAMVFHVSENFHNGNREARGGGSAAMGTAMVRRPLKRSYAFHSTFESATLVS